MRIVIGTHNNFETIQVPFTFYSCPISHEKESKRLANSRGSPVYLTFPAVSCRIADRLTLDPSHRSPRLARLDSNLLRR